MNVEVMMARATTRGQLAKKQQRLLSYDWSISNPVYLDILGYFSRGQGSMGREILIPGHSYRDAVPLRLKLRRWLANLMTFAAAIERVQEGPKVGQVVESILASEEKFHSLFTVVNPFCDLGERRRYEDSMMTILAPEDCVLMEVNDPRVQPRNADQIMVSFVPSEVPLDISRPVMVRLSRRWGYWSYKEVEMAREAPLVLLPDTEAQFRWKRPLNIEDMTAILFEIRRMRGER